MSGVAMVTGGRRGIGHSTAIALAERGMRVAITSRSYGPGPHGETPDFGDIAPSGERPGGAGMKVRMDLSDRASIDAAVDSVLRTWGTIDVLVNNALCDQPGSQALIDETDFGAFETMIVGEVVNTAYLTKLVLEKASRPLTVVNVGSAAADHVPARPVRAGGWAFSYAASKAALHRLTPFLQLEYGNRIRAFTVNPGYVRTEALLERLGDVPGSAPPEVPAAVIAWLATSPAADAHVGGYLHANEIAALIGVAP